MYVQSAIDSVNKAVEHSSTKKMPKRNVAHVDESLDSLDYFKVTNLGRFGTRE
jgi:hypothetical protein